MSPLDNNVANRLLKRIAILVLMGSNCERHKDKLGLPEDRKQTKKTTMITNRQIEKRAAKIRKARASHGLPQRLPDGSLEKIERRLNLALPDPPTAIQVWLCKGWQQERNVGGTVVLLGCSPDMPAYNYRKWTNCVQPGRTTQIQETDNGKGGWDRVITSRYWSIRSVARIVAGGRGIIWYSDKLVTGSDSSMYTRALIAAPKGWLWSEDNNGVRLQNRKNKSVDYHPSALELCTVSTRGIARCAWTNWEAGRKARTEERKNRHAIASADKRGVRVGMLDSLAAGNCEQGTRNFAARHGLDPSKWYRPADLLKIANGDAQRVRLTVAVAVKRHDTWTQAGAEVFYPKF